jgi:hypothetical protein
MLQTATKTAAAPAFQHLPADHGPVPNPLPKLLSGEDLPIERGIAFAADDSRRSSLPIAGNAFGGRSRSQGIDHRAFGWSGRPKFGHLAESEID